MSRSIQEYEYVGVPLPPPMCRPEPNRAHPLAVRGLPLPQKIRSLPHTGHARPDALGQRPRSQRSDVTAQASQPERHSPAGDAAATAVRRRRLVEQLGRKRQRLK